ncbi:MAG: hypothetical protein ACLFQB_01395 [Chitinispirillaceae bacterium]
MIREVGKSLFFRSTKAEKAPEKKPAELKKLLQKFIGTDSEDKSVPQSQTYTPHRGFKLHDSSAQTSAVESAAPADSLNQLEALKHNPRSIQNRLAAQNSDAAQSIISNETAVEIAKQVREKLISEGAGAAFGRFNEISRTNAMVLLK